jgi:hypothetical protein
MTTTPTTTVRLDEVPGLAGWTASIRPGTVTDPRPVLVVADVGAVVQAAERIDGLEDVDRTPLIEEAGAQTGTLVDMLVDPAILDGALLRAIGRRADALPGAARILAQAADVAWWERTCDAERAEVRQSARPAGDPADDDAVADDAEWDF